MEVFELQEYMDDRMDRIEELLRLLVVSKLSNELPELLDTVPEKLTASGEESDLLQKMSFAELRKENERLTREVKLLREENARLKREKAPQHANSSCADINRSFRTQRTGEVVDKDKEFKEKIAICERIGAKLCWLPEIYADIEGFEPTQHNGYCVSSDETIGILHFTNGDSIDIRAPVYGYLFYRYHCSVSGKKHPVSKDDYIAVVRNRDFLDGELAKLL